MAEFWNPTGMTVRLRLGSNRCLATSCGTWERRPDFPVLGPVSRGSEVWPWLLFEHKYAYRRATQKY